VQKGRKGDKMGMASYYNYGEVEIVNEDGLKEFLIAAERSDLYRHYVDALEVDYKNKTISFEGFDGWKIISYWYPQLLVFLRGLAIFVEGFVMFTFESGDERARIKFEDAEVIIDLGTMNYVDVKLEELMGEDRLSTSDMLKKLKEDKKKGEHLTTSNNLLPRWLQKHKLLRKL